MPRATSSGMPQISAAFAGWTTTIKLIRQTESVVNGLVQVVQTPMTFKGTLQPLSARAIELKPEGQRSWTWLQLHCLATSSILIPGDRVQWNNEIYKVMEQNDYSLNGYVEYHLARDYQDGGPR